MKFLTAEWLNLIMLNWEIEPRLLGDIVPKGTELDYWGGKTFVSLVGFQFNNTKVMGVKIPFHVNFAEVNLRFYVIRRVGEEIRRGVVFIKEFVPRWWIAFIARKFYNENYFAVRMNHDITLRDGRIGVEYQWETGSKLNSIFIEAGNNLVELEDNSFEEFFAGHYCGYVKQPDGSTREYRVTHPRWRFSAAGDVKTCLNNVELYGEAIGGILQSSPSSAFLLDGSIVTVGFGKKI